MFANRLTVCACCAFLTYVFATEAVNIGTNDRTDYGIISDIVDYDLASIRNPDQLLAELSKLMPQEINTFLQRWKRVRNAKECNEILLNDLIALYDLAAPSQQFGKPIVSKMVHKHILIANSICLKDLENHYEVVIKRDVAKTIRDLFEPIGLFMAEKCREDKFCLNTKFAPSQLLDITKAIYGFEIDGKEEINRIRVSEKMLKITSTCKLIADRRAKFLDYMVARGHNFDGYTSDWMKLRFLCRSYKGKEHKHINELARLNGEPPLETPCYELDYQEGRPRRSTCPED